MKTLRLLRHAKSAWDVPGLADHERGLNERGRLDAPKMGTALADHVPPHGLHVSPARRAQLTLEGLCEGWPALRDCHHVTDEALYTFSSEDVLYWLAARDDLLHSVLWLYNRTGPRLRLMRYWVALRYKPRRRRIRSSV